MHMYSLMVKTLDSQQHYWGMISIVFSSIESFVLCPPNYVPMSNGKVERMFSILRSIKTEKWTRLSEDNLDDLM